MLPIQQARFPHPAGMGDHLHFVHQVLRVVCHPHSLVFRIQALLQFLVVGGDAGRAGILVALQGLHAAQGEHEPPRRIHAVRAHA